MKPIPCGYEWGVCGQMNQDGLQTHLCRSVVNHGLEHVCISCGESPVHTQFSEAMLHYSNAAENLHPAQGSTMGDLRSSTNDAFIRQNDRHTALCIASFICWASGGAVRRKA